MEYCTIRHVLVVSAFHGQRKKTALQTLNGVMNVLRLSIILASDTHHPENMTFITIRYMLSSCMTDQVQSAVAIE